MKEVLFKFLICITTIVILLNILMIFSQVNADNFDLGKYDGSKEGTITNPINNISKEAITVIRIIGAGVALIMIAFVAMKYMIAAPGERADLKKSSIQFVIGAVIVFAATNILTLIIDFVKSSLDIK